MKQLIKLAIAALVTYAAWNGANAWLTYFRFRDAVSELSQFGGGLSEDQLRQRVLDTAAQHSIPLSEDDLTVRRDEDRVHTYIDGSYTQTINVLPWYSRPFTFAFHTDTMSVTAPKAAPSSPP
jgi:hypothetical protein